MGGWNTTVNADGTISFGEIGNNTNGGGFIYAISYGAGFHTATSAPYALVPTADHPGRIAVPGAVAESLRGENGPRLVSLASATPGAAIRYTLNGSAPDESSPLYTGPILLTRTAELRAVAFAEDLAPSAGLAETIEVTFDFAAWADWHDLTGDSAAPGADPHGRGVPNLLAYAFGIQESGLPSPGMDGFGNPSSFSPTPAMALAPDSPRLTLRFPVRRDAPDLVYEALFAPSPAGPWEPAPIAVVPHDHHWDEATAEDPSAGEAARFGKVRVSGEEGGSGVME